MSVKWTPGVNFINVLLAAFVCADPKSIKRLKLDCLICAFGICLKNVDEIDSWAQFHQHSTYSFYGRRSQKHKKILTTWLTLTSLGTTWVKSACKYVGEIDPWTMPLRKKVEWKRKKDKLLFYCDLEAIL